MPPRRTPSKAASANDADVDSRAPPTNTPKRTVRSYRIRQENTTLGNASSSHDELDISARVGDTDQTRAEDEVVLDEIVVFGTPQNANIKGVDLNGQSAIAGNPAQNSTMLKRSSRASSSISQSGSSTLSPSGKGVTIKKQDFVVSIAADDDGKPDELSDVPVSKKRKVDVHPTKRVAFRKSRSKWDNCDEVLTDPNSPLVNAKLRELLCSPRAWDILTHEEREKILAKFPDDAEILNPGTPDARPNIAALRNNNNFRNDVARYQEGLSRGFHDPEWVEQAQAAHRSRQLGFYDEFRAADFEEKWDMPMLQQTQARPEMNGNGNRYGSEEQPNDASAESNTIVSSMTDHCQGTCSPPKAQPADIPYKDTTEGSIKDRKGDPKDTNGSKVQPMDNTSWDEDKKRDGLPEIDTKGEPTQDYTEPGGQKLGDSSKCAETPNVPSLPTAMEVVEQKAVETRPGTPKTQQVDVVEDTDTLMDTTAQITFTSNQIVEGVVDEAQQRRDGEDVQQKSKAAEHPPSDE